MRSSSLEQLTALMSVDETVPPLRAGDFLSREEFLRRWEALPNLKRAELIGGVVYMPSPLSWEHGRTDRDVATWMGTYQAATPGCDGANNATWQMGTDSPQPDNSLRLLPEYGGQSRMDGLYPSGAPEFLAETCLTSASYDLHQKLELYQEAGVQEYLAVLVHEREVRWHRRVGERFEVMPPPADGIYRSTVFPGLWLDGAALLAGDLARVLAVLHQGLASTEHQAFVARLASRQP